MEWFPTVSIETDSVAIPAFRVPLPSVALPSKNVTVPVAAAGDTVAVNITDWAKTAGLRFDATAIADAESITV